MFAKSWLASVRTRVAGRSGARSPRPRAQLGVEALEERLTPATYSYSGGTFVFNGLTDPTKGNYVNVSTPADNTVQISLLNGDTFTTGSQNGITVSGSTATINTTTAPLTNLTLNLKSGNDGLTLAVGGNGVTSTGVGSLAVNMGPGTVENLFLDAANVSGNLTATANEITVYGGVNAGGNLGLTAQVAGISAESGSLTAGGNITLVGTGVGGTGVQIGVPVQTSGATNQITITGTAADYNGVGVSIDGSNAQVVTQDGNLTVNGTGGGADGSAEDGVELGDGAFVGSFGRGTVSLTGTAGNSTYVSGFGTSNNNDGVSIDNAQVFSAGGAVTITGTGNGSGSDEYGVFIGGTNASNLNNNGVTAAVFANGAVTIKGTGSSTGEDGNDGVFITGSVTPSSPEIQAAYGLLGITGVGGGTVGVDFSGNPTNGNDGVAVAAVVAGASVNLTGTGGSGLGGANVGVLVTGGGQVASTAGSLAITGTGGSGTSSLLGVNDAGVQVVAGSAVLGNGGAVTITGNGNGPGSGEDGVDVLDGSRVQAFDSNPLTIKGSASSGGTDNSVGVLIGGSSTLVSTESGTLTLNGTGGGSGAFDYGVAITAAAAPDVLVQATSNGVVSISGTAGSGTGGDNAGVFLQQATVSTTGSKLSFAGTGGSGGGGGNNGVTIAASVLAATSPATFTPAVTGSAATDLPVATDVQITPSTASLAADATTLTINGSGFDPNAANDTVTFSGGATGTVSSVNAAGTQLTVGNLTGLTAGALLAAVTADGVPSSWVLNAKGVPTNTVQVATVAAAASTPPATPAQPALGPLVVAAPAADPGPALATPDEVVTSLVKLGKHWYLLIQNTDPAYPFVGQVLLQGLSKKQARTLGLPSAATPLFVSLPPGGVLPLALPFTPSGALTGIAL
jgi:hypothetical protein